MTFKEYSEKKCKLCINKKVCEEKITRRIDGNIECENFLIDFKLWKKGKDKC